MLERTCCLLTYQSSIFKEPKVMCFAPQKLIAYRESLNVTGFIVPAQGSIIIKSNEPTNLSVHRIVKIEEQPDRKAEYLPAIKLAQNKEFGFMNNSKFTCKIRFSQDAATYVTERKWSDDQKITINREDSSVILEFSARSRQEVVSFVLGFGPAASVLEPEDVRDMVISSLKDAVKNYGQ